MIAEFVNKVIISFSKCYILYCLQKPVHPMMSNRATFCCNEMMQKEHSTLPVCVFGPTSANVLRRIYSHNSWPEEYHFFRCQTITLIMFPRETMPSNLPLPSYQQQEKHCFPFASQSCILLVYFFQGRETASASHSIASSTISSTTRLRTTG